LMALPDSDSRTRVLIVEDEAMIALSIEDTLSDLGYAIVGIAPRLEIGMRMAREEAIDFAILDLNLNGEVSFPIARVLRERGVPFLFASGFGAESVELEFQGAPVIRKPFDVGALTAAIDTLGTSSPTATAGASCLLDKI
jgi:DNA-binding response OmpR family regulator